MCIRDSINTVINAALVGLDAADTYAVDAAMLQADGTKDKSNLGACLLYTSQRAHDAACQQYAAHAGADAGLEVHVKQAGGQCAGCLLYTSRCV